MSNKDFYRAFEDKHRGSRELIMNRISVYLPFVNILKNQYKNAKVLDIGCGRGEWLELLTNNNISAKGVDLDIGMLKACKSLDLDTEHADGIEYLKTQEDESCIVISAFHVVEHISFENLQILVKEALRVLKPGGILIMETPNAENIKVATENFYLDPTHINPIPSSLLTFLPEFYGYYRTKVLGLQEDKELENQENISLFQVLEGVSRDYAVIAQKTATNKILEEFDGIFKKDVGLSLHRLTEKFENRLLNIEEKIRQSEEKSKQTEERIRHSEEKSRQTEENYHLIINSSSWKVMRPFRIMVNFLRWFIARLKHWISFAPTSRPRRVLKRVFISLKERVNTHPKLRSKILKILNKFPKLKERMQKINNNKVVVVHTPSELSPRADEIYHNFKNLQKKTTKDS